MRTAPGLSICLHNLLFLNLHIMHIYFSRNLIRFYIFRLSILVSIDLLFNMMVIILSICLIHILLISNYLMKINVLIQLFCNLVAIYIRIFLELAFTFNFIYCRFQGNFSCYFFGTASLISDKP